MPDDIKVTDKGVICPECGKVIETFSLSQYGIALVVKLDKKKNIQTKLKGGEWEKLSCPHCNFPSWDFNIIAAKG